MTSVGLLQPTRDRVSDGHPDVGPILELAECAEDVGLDFVWVGDSPLARPRHDPLTLLAATAARTTRVTVGTAVLLAPIRQPLLTLHQVATVDLVSEGRLVLGLGAGAPLAQTRAQFAALEADYANRNGRLEDTISLDWIGAYQGAGADHIVVRVAGDLDTTVVTRLGELRTELVARHTARQMSCAVVHVDRSARRHD